MEKKIWAATFMDGTRASAPGVVVSYPGIIDGRRIVELGQNFGKLSAEEHKEYTDILDGFYDKMMPVAKYEMKIPEDIAPVTCSLARGLTRRNLAKNMSKSIFRAEYADYLCTEASAVALFDVELGENQLLRMNVQDEKGILIEDYFLYLFHAMEQREFVVGQSLSDIGLTYIESGRFYRLVSGKVRDNSISISREALDCTVDIWRDRLLSNTLFITNRLKEKLDETGAAKTWKLRECRVEG